MSAAPALPESIRVFERGWLSSNNVLLVDEARAALVDTGYATHAGQTLALVRHALGPRALDLVVNTHLHSDHCGGNARLQAQWPCATLIPAASATIVRDWDEAQLSFRATGQTCERFAFTGTLAPGERLALGGFEWEVIGAPGHDPDSVMLYAAGPRLLISADALWEHGFGVIFPELEGASGFAEQHAVLEAIAKLDVRVVIPGHGRPFTNVEAALERAFSRLAWLRADPARNAKNALKVLIVFKLLEVRAMTFGSLLAMLENAASLRAAAQQLAPRGAWPALLRELAGELATSGALVVHGERLEAPAAAV
ncbi:MBL fold metallo-hydrolase [Paraburkholderia silvatlantica]|uniref:Glyoxylase-like metal-dependent hydrolase (Beta-lactamase superfamily II) n=1 Tax=Paraburkholderia silvatlantica TaxID=321895 RepID=A0A2U1AKP4_9BURK|nr:MBL fold metallo-hydrolase [Paraburkholderia silvatlantica]MBB2927271.1 glyoxylase-like metal-dependent hydrolase (beta-lactamase superfamily II) [Paraburkholderia silvatlantica]PVY36988.1 glyoxylase-like metal-dependent hydrolase (beta-lactamase superfamily II) [Paraburkholderia silvatlantica]PXW41734.1 glyoxylase-like metal-dependent hydrolase (beta-lactamase superfamily II) [Paraburkholderia silvatlantica]PYE26201.1 glyoxylase-like metal-dependent hydrolase (beta-lactamase superfamily II)